MRYALGGDNNYRATWINDDIPRIMTAGQTYQVTVTVRNDGWDSWSEVQSYRLGHAIVQPDIVPVYADYDSRGRVYIPGSAAIQPGETCTFVFMMQAPQTEGEYDLYLDLVRDGVTWFREHNNLPWKKNIYVSSNLGGVDTDKDGMPDVEEEAEGRLYWNPDDFTLELDIKDFDASTDEITLSWVMLDPIKNYQLYYSSTLSEATQWHPIPMDYQVDNGRAFQRQPIPFLISPVFYKLEAW